MNRTAGISTFSSAIFAVTAAGAASAQNAAAGAYELQSVVVTAERRSESAQDIPVSVAVISGDTLTKNSIKDLVQAATLIPGVVFSRAPDDGLALTFRGLGTVARSQAFDLSEALFVDGTFMGKGRLYTTSMFDVDRMEFIKGTESTLLGKNSSLGAISVITRQPGSFGHGSKAGGFAETNTISVAPNLLVDGKVPAALVAAGAEIKDEFARSYELGMKSTLMDRRLLLNIDGFWTDVKNFQDTVFTGGPLGFITFNGPARTRGAELQTALQVAPNFRVGGGLTYADATGVIQPIDPATSAPEVDTKGNPVYANYTRSQAPKIMVNIDGQYEKSLTGQLDLQASANLRYRSMMFNQRQEMFPSDALTTVDLSVAIARADGHWGVQVAARNLFNRISEDFASPAVDPRFGAFYGAYLAGPTATRTVMLSASTSTR
jgi:outer membrane receptor protein involved in Fe transport